MPSPRRSTPARAPDLDALEAPAETAPWQRFTIVGDATRRDTRPSTARRSSTREAGAPGASRSPTGRMIAGSTASRCDEKLRMEKPKNVLLCLDFCCETQTGFWSVFICDWLNGTRGPISLADAESAQVLSHKYGNLSDVMHDLHSARPPPVRARDLRLSPKEARH